MICHVDAKQLEVSVCLVMALLNFCFRAMSESLNASKVLDEAILEVDVLLLLVFERLFCS